MQKPEIARVTNFEKSGETVQIFGENFDKDTVIYQWRPNRDEDKDFSQLKVPFSEELPELPPEDASVYKLTFLADSQVVYVGSEERAYAGTSIIWAKNEAGFSKPFVINKPEIWNQSVRDIYPGGIVTVYGDGMWSAQYKAVCLKNTKSGEIRFLKPVYAKSPVYFHDSYRYYTAFRMPEDACDGEYEIFVHSGTAGVYGWSKPVTVTVKSEYTVTDYYRTKFNRDATDELPVPKCAVKAVEPDIMGVYCDMTDKIQNAIDELGKQGGGILILGAGTYAISRTLTLRKGVVLQGAGQNATTIRSAYGCEFTQDWSDVVYASRPSGHDKGWAEDWEPHWKKLNHHALVRIYDESGIDNVRLELGGGVSIGVLVAGNDEKSFVNRAFLNEVTVDGDGCGVHHDERFGILTMGLAGISSTYELTVFKCNFAALSPVYLLPANNYGSRFVKNIIRCSPKQKDESFFCGMHSGIFIENDFVDGRRSFMSQGGFDNNWVYQNRSTGVSRCANGNEVYMSEHGDIDWTGYPKSFGKDYLDIDISETKGMTAPAYQQYRDPLTDQSNKEVPRLIVIISGRGFGQYRFLKSVEERNGISKLILDTPWDVLPDETTVFTVVTGTWHNHWIDNNSELSNSHSQFIWNCGIENIISGHEISLSAGIRLYSNCYYARGNMTAVVAFNRIVHCMVRGSGKGIWLDSDGRRINGRKPDYVLKTGGGVFGNSIRDCAFDGSAHMIYTKNLPTFEDHGPHAGVAVGGAYNTVCNNRIGGYTVAVKLLDECIGNCFENNVYVSDSVKMAGKGVPLGNDIKRENIKL